MIHTYCIRNAHNNITYVDAIQSQFANRNITILSRIIGSDIETNSTLHNVFVVNDLLNFAFCFLLVIFSNATLPFKQLNCFPFIDLNTELLESYDQFLQIDRTYNNIIGNSSYCYFHLLSIGAEMWFRRSEEIWHIWEICVASIFTEVAQTEIRYSRS